MTVSKCSVCGVELLPEAKFCRQCGATATNGAPTSSELPTEALSERVGDITTRRLEPRPTSPDRVSLGPFAHDAGSAAPGQVPRGRPGTALIGALVLLVVIGIIAAAAYMRMHSGSTNADNAALIYPQSRKIVDMSGTEGRAIQLETTDSLDRVLAWYDASLKPTKTMRLTSTSVVLKNGKVTATIASEDGKTNILIKQLP